MVGFLLGEVVSTKKKLAGAKDVVGLLVGDSKYDSLYYKRLKGVVVIVVVVGVYRK